jgi:hypothetical protein
MTLNLYDILQQVLNEAISPNDVNNAIDNHLQVIIKYSDEKNRAPETRLIEPYVYGKSKSGNDVLRAYQYEGDTFRGKPKWKLFRLDRITQWNPTENHFNAEPLERGWNAQSYNDNGDGSMSVILNQVSFNYDNNNTNPYEKGSDLYNIRKRTDNLKQSKPINVNDLKPNSSGPIMTNNTQQTSHPQQPEFGSDDFQKMLQRNLDITRKEKEKRGFALSQPNDNSESSIPPSGVIPQSTTTDSQPPQPTQNPQNDEAFKEMLRKNLERTKKEKEKRGFSLS